MELTANKGEWSELYAFFKILSDKRIYSADESLKLIPESFLKVLTVIRTEDNEDLFFKIDEENDQILVKNRFTTLSIIPIYKISSKLAVILEKMKIGSNNKGSGKKGVFSLPEAEILLNDLHVTKTKSPSNRKTDISLQIEDPHTGTQPIRGFSIKSKIGGLSTLLNASGATNFEFEIVDVDNENKTDKNPLIGLKKLIPPGKCLKFSCIPNKKLNRNLTMIDSRMPDIMGEVVKAYYLGIKTSLTDLIKYIEKEDPLQVGDHKHFYEYKIQELLLAVAFGMQPSKIWNGSYETHGGYIIVKENGDLACYHVYDRDKFKKFLSVNTKLDTPSTSRHRFGTIYDREGRSFILLNLQIRFRK